MHKIVVMKNRSNSSIRVNAGRNRTFLVLLSLIISCFAASGQTTYKWNKTGSQSFTTAANWTPARNTPAVTDILVFDGNGVSGTVTTVTNVPSQAIGGLVVSNNTNVTLTTPAAAGVYTLSVNNGTAAADLSVASGSQLNLAGTRATVISLATGAKAAIAGNITFTNAAHQLLGADASSVTFNSPAVFTASTGFTGYAFGNTGTANTVIFSSGTVYASTAGSDPFGLAAPLSKIVFNGGSLYRTNQANGAGVVLNGRIYANIDFNGSGTATISGAAGFTADSIKVSRGTVNIGMTGAAFVRGNINVAGGTRLNLNGNTVPLLLNGTVQRIYGSGGLTLLNGQAVEIPTGTTVNLVKGITVTGATTSFTVKGTMNAANITVSGTGIFNLNSGATLGIGSTSGITVAGTNAGNIRTASRIYSPAANYIYNGTANQSTGNGLPSTVNTLTISNTGTAPANIVGFTTAVTISNTANSFRLLSGVVNLNNKQLTIPNGGTVTVTAGSFNTTAGPVAFAGSGTVTGTVRFPTVTIAGPVNFGTGTVIVTSLKINTGGSVVTNSPAYGSASTLIYACGCSAFTTGLEWMPGTIAGPGVPSNINVNLAATTNTLTLSGDRTVVNRLTLTSGNLAIGSHILTLKGIAARTGGYFIGSHTSELVITSTAGNLYFASGGTNNYLKNLTVNTAASAALSTALNITGGTGAGTEGTLTVQGTGVLTTRGLLTIKSNQYGTARIAEGRTTGGYISGAVTVERYIPKNTNKAWRLVTASTTGQTIKQAWQENQSALANGNPGYGTMIPGKAATLAAAQSLGFDSLSPGASLYKYNPVTDNLDPILNTGTTQISSEQGYFIFIRGDRSPGQMGLGAGNAATTSTTLRSTGSIYQGNQAAVSVPAGRYALVRNPYASAIDLTKLLITGGLVDAFQVWDPKLNGLYGSGAYQTFSRSGANYVITPGGGSYGANGSINNTIESGSAFFVQSVATAGTIQVLESSKTAGSNTVFRPSGTLAGNERLLFSLYANNNNNTDLVDGGLMFFDDAYSNAVDINDVRKSPNFSENIGILKSSTELVVEKRPTVTTDDTVYFKMYQLGQLTYTLQLVAENMQQPGMTAWLVDKYLHTEVPVNLNDTTLYDFAVDANAASYADDRFKIVFRPMIVLPVTFTSIKATPAGKRVGVEWKVTTQLNIDHYEIERSGDGRSFAKVATVQAHSVTTYNWLDENSLNGTSFYRVKAVEMNGHFKYTDIAKCTMRISGNPVTVSPNPVQNGFVNIQFTDQPAGKYYISLINTIGQVIYKTEIQYKGGIANHRLGLPSVIGKGVFELIIKDPESKVTSQRLLFGQ